MCLDYRMKYFHTRLRIFLAVKFETLRPGKSELSYHSILFILKLLNSNEFESQKFKEFVYQTYSRVDDC